MSWLPGFATPLAAALFALLIPLVIFYFLKLKRPRVEIPSLALWRSVIQDQRVNSPLQKFKRNLLLLLQVIALCGLVLAAMQPYLRGEAGVATHLPILIDCSASMSATDAAGRTRLDLAKSEVRNIIDNLLPDQKVTLIAVSDSAQRLTEFTSNQRVLSEALEGIEVAEVQSNLTDGLQLAQALARTFSIESVWLYSDGNLPTRPDPNVQRVAMVDFDLPFVLDFHKLSEAGPNLGITALSAQREGAAGWNVFVRIEGTTDTQTAGEIQLLLNDIPQGEARQVVLERGQSQRLVFRHDSPEAARLQLRLTPDGEDSLAADNIARLELPASRPLDVYCPEKLISYRHALESLDGVSVSPTGGAGEDLATWDLVVSDDLEDAEHDAATYLFIGVIPPGLQPLMRIESGSAQVVDYKRDSELLRHVQFQDVEITDQVMLQEGVDSGDVEALGYEILADGNTGPLMLRKRDGRTLSFYLLFHTDQSTLPYRVGFPVMVSNLVETAREQSALSEVRGTTTGVLPPLLVKPRHSYEVESPEGPSVSRTSDAEGYLSGIRAAHVGTYTVRDGSDVVQQVGASLLSPTESSLFGLEEIQFRELKVAAQEERADIDRPLWPTLATIALIALLAEWWLFQRRPWRATP